MGKESLIVKDWCDVFFMKVKVVIKKSKYKESAGGISAADLSVKKRNPSSDFS